MIHNYTTAADHPSAVRCSPHDATTQPPTTMRLSPHQQPPSPVDLYSAPYPTSSSIDFMRSMGSLDNMFGLVDGLCQQQQQQQQQRLPQSYYESFSGTSSDTSDATQQRRHLGHYYPTPPQAIPASHGHHHSTPPHQQPLIAARRRHPLVGQDPAKSASPVNCLSTFIASAYHGSASLPPAQPASEYDYLPSPPAHSSDDKHPETLYLDDASPNKQFRPTADRQSPASPLDFHPFPFYDCMLPEATPAARYPPAGNILSSNSPLFAPLSTTQDNRRAWRRSNRRHVLPADSKRSTSPSRLSSLAADHRLHRCSECNRPFNRQQDLKRHQKSVHEKDHRHCCEVCHRGFSRHDSLLRHQRKCRSDASPDGGGDSRSSPHRRSHRAAATSFSAASRRRGSSSSSIYYK